jgi:hypothetical protein
MQPVQGTLTTAAAHAHGMAHSKQRARRALVTGMADA